MDQKKTSPYAAHLIMGALLVITGACGAFDGSELEDSSESAAEVGGAGPRTGIIEPARTGGAGGQSEGPQGGAGASQSRDGGSTPSGGEAQPSGGEAQPSGGAPGGTAGRTDTNPGGAAGAAETGGEGGAVGMPGTDAFPLLGYATSGQGTAGGQGDPSPTTVDTAAALQRAIDAKGPGPLTVFVQGRLTLAGGRIRLAGVSDLSILGLGDSAELDGVALDLDGASNIVIRNLRIHHVQAESSDAIRIINGSHHIWIDHCTLHSDLDSGPDFYDGLIDITHAGDFITISWNHLHTHFKATLVGHDDNNGAEDAGTFHITYHHNLFERLSTHLPSVRFGSVHVFNNHYLDITDEGERSGVAVSSRVGACVRVEHNRFDSVQTPVVTDQSPLSGAVQLIDNRFDDVQPGTLPDCVLDPPYGYLPALEPADGLAATLRSQVGVGVLSAPDEWSSL